MITLDYFKGKEFKHKIDNVIIAHINVLDYQTEADHIADYPVNMLMESLKELEREIEGARDLNEEDVKVLEKVLKHIKDRIDQRISISGDFGKWLREVRVSSGLTQRALSKLSTVSPAMINRLENGRRLNLSLEKACLIGMHFKDVTVEDIAAKYNECLLLEQQTI